MMNVTASSMVVITSDQQLKGKLCVDAEEYEFFSFGWQLLKPVLVGIRFSIDHANDDVIVRL